MDFGFTADQEELKRLAAKVFSDGRAGGADDAFGELARAGLLGVALPVEHGGAGLGVLELCLLLEQAGRAASTAPLVPALIAASAISEFGDEAQREILPRVALGENFLTLALHEAGAEPERPMTRATPDGDGFKLDGVKVAVPSAERATLAIVPARLPDGATALFLVALNPATASGVRRDRETLTDDTIVHQLTFSGARVDGHAQLAPGRGAAALAWILERVAIGLCAFELGLAARQLEMTAEHAVRRQQFGKPIGAFQAVGQRAADMYIDVESLRLTTWQAAFALADGRAAQDELAVAAFFASEAGARVAAAAQHLHGGIGFDRAYPLYKYFLAARRVELELGGAHRQLARLGARLAAVSS